MAANIEWRPPPGPPSQLSSHLETVEEADEEEEEEEIRRGGDPYGHPRLAARTAVDGGGGGGAAPCAAGSTAEGYRDPTAPAGEPPPPRPAEGLRLALPPEAPDRARPPLTLHPGWLDELLAAHAAPPDAAGRGLIQLAVPSLARRFADGFPARAAGADGQPHLLVLPSDRPTARADAAAVAAFLDAVARAPAAAAEHAAAWRARTLVDACGPSLRGLAAEYQPPVLPGDAVGGAASAAPGATSPWYLHQQQAKAAAGAGPAAKGGARAGKPQGKAAAAAGAAAEAWQIPAAAGAAAAPAGDEALSAPQLPVLDPAAAPLGGGADAPADGGPSPAVPADGGAGSAAWDSHCAGAVSAALAAAAAELVRQVEVGCAERGRALARAWNLTLAVLGAGHDALAREVTALRRERAGTAAALAAARRERAEALALRLRVAELERALRCSRAGSEDEGG